MSALVPDDKVELYEHFFRDPRVGEGVLRPPMAGIACRNIRDALRFLDYRLEPGEQYDADLVHAMSRFQTDRRHTSGDGLTGPGTRRLLTRAVIERHEGFFGRGRISPEYAVFFSYSRQDEAALADLLAGLRARGIPLFRDQEAIPGGASWPDMLYRSVLKCQVFLCMLSPHSANSIHVLIEVALARHAARRIIPVLLNPVQLPRALQALLEGIQYVDLTNQPTSDAAIHELSGILALHGLGV